MPGVFTTMTLLAAGLLAAVPRAVRADDSWILSEWQGQGPCSGDSTRLSGSGTASCYNLAGVHAVNGNSDEGGGWASNVEVVACYYDTADCGGHLIVAISGEESSCGCCDQRDGTGQYCLSRQIVSGSGPSACPGYYEGFESMCD